MPNIFSCVIVLLCTICPAANAMSQQVDVYVGDASAIALSVDQIYGNTLGGVTLGTAETNERKAVISFYRELGFDVSVDLGNVTYSPVLNAKFPQHWSTTTPKPLTGDFAGPYSIDACFNNPIPTGTPRLAINRTFSNVQVTSPNSLVYPGGDGVGIGVAIAGIGDPVQSIVQAWSNFNGTQGSVSMHVPASVANYKSTLIAGDEALILIDGSDASCLTLYEARLVGDARGITNYPNESWNNEGLRAGYHHRCLSFSSKHRLDGIGAEGRAGTCAAGMPFLGCCLRPGEVNNANAPIAHALCVNTNKLMKGRIYPAVGCDSFINSPANTGSLPYGALLQFDPAIDLNALYVSNKLSLQGYRILQAMQTYGWYLVDSSDGGSGTGRELGIYGANPASDYNVTPPSVGWGGVYAVQQELQNLLSGNGFFGVGTPRWYVVAPVVRYVSLSVPNTAAGTVGAAFALSLSAEVSSGSPAFSASGLPPGLMVSGAVINGTPTSLGTYTATISAGCAGGVESRNVLFTVSGAISNNPPTVELTAPTMGSSWTAGESLSLMAAASDVDGSVNKVEFLVDGAVVGEAMGVPYSYRWIAILGNHRLSVRATDNLGLVTISGETSITVLAAPAPSPVHDAGGSGGGCGSGLAIAFHIALTFLALSAGGVRIRGKSQR